MSKVTEIWKYLPNNPRYNISDHGTLWDNDQFKIIPSYVCNQGYPTVCIRYNESTRFIPIAVHRLVIWGFTGFLSTVNHQVNHIDGNKLNSHLSNLEVVTPAENVAHAYRIGLHDESMNKRRETIRKSKLI